MPTRPALSRPAWSTITAPRSPCPEVRVIGQPAQRALAASAAWAPTRAHSNGRKIDGIAVLDAVLAARG